MDSGLLLILALCAIGLFAVILSVRMRNDTKSRYSATDEVLTGGRGNAYLYALRAEKTGLSRLTVCMLLASGVLLVSVGVWLLIKHTSPGFTLIGAGVVFLGLVTFARNSFSIFKAIRNKQTWVMLIQQTDMPRFWILFVVAIPLAVGLMVLGIIFETMHIQHLAFPQATVAVVLPSLLAALLGYWNIRKLK